MKIVNHINFKKLIATVRAASESKIIYNVINTFKYELSKYYEYLNTQGWLHSLTRSNLTNVPIMWKRRRKLSVVGASINTLISSFEAFTLVVPRMRWIYKSKNDTFIIKFIKLINIFEGGMHWGILETAKPKKKWSKTAKKTQPKPKTANRAK